MNDNSTTTARASRNDYEEGGFSLNLADLRAMLRRQKVTLIASVIAALGLGFLVTFLQQPEYESSSSVQYDFQPQRIVEGGEIRDGVKGPEVQRYLESQVALLQSQKLANRVIDDLQLDTNESFLLAMNVEPTADVSSGSGSEVGLRRQVSGALLSNIDVSLPFNSNVMTISFSSPDSGTAIRIASAYAENLISGNLEQQFEANSYAREFLEKEIQDAKAQLEASERAVLEYAKISSIIDASDGFATNDGESTPKSITTTNLLAINSAATEARTQRIKAEERWQQARKTPLMQLPAVVSNPAIQALQAERTKQYNRNQELSARYGPEHPLFQETSGQLNTIDGQIRKMAEDIRSVIRDEFEIAQNQEKALSRDLDQLKNLTVAEKEKRVQLNLLNREVDTERALYQSLLERFKQISTQSAIVTNNITILDNAESAERVSPKPLVNMLFALVAGLGVGFLLAFLREMFDDSVRTPDDVTRKLGLPVIGTTPVYNPKGDLLQVLKDSKSQLSEAYASIRSALDFSGESGMPNSILMTSSQPSEGKSTSSIAICAAYAKMGKRVLLIDADLRRPSLHHYMGMQNNGGFVALLTDQSTIAEQAQKNDEAGFDLLSSGPIPPDPSLLLSSKAIARFIEKHKANYDLLLFDGPPVMGLADSPQISAVTEGTLMIVESSRAQGGKAKSALRRLADVNANVLGVLLTKVNSKQSGYGDTYGYTYDYGDESSEPPSWIDRFLGRTN